MKAKHQRSFLGSIQGYFSSTFEGRYFSLILAEVLKREPTVIRLVFPGIHPKVVEGVRTGQFTVVTEYRIKQRIADLAILSPAGVLAIAEIKQTDIIGQGVTGQLQDYRQFVRTAPHRIHFSLVSMHSPDKEHMHVLDKPWGHGTASPVRFHDIANGLAQHTDRPVIQLFLDFLKEQRMSGYRSLEATSSTLPLLMTRFLPIQHAHGFGRLQSNKSVREVAELLDTLLQNTQYMADWFRAGNTDLLPRAFASEFRTRPWYDYGRLARYLTPAKIQGNDFHELPRNQCCGGSLDVYVQGRLSAKSIAAPKGHDIQFYLGYWIELDVQHNTLKPYLYVGTSGGNAFKESYRDFHDAHERCQLSWDENTIRQRLLRLARKAVNNASKNAISPRLKKALKAMQFNGY